MLKFVSQYEQPNKFNEDIILKMRQEDNMVNYLVDVCKALETITYIKFDGYEVIEDENKFKPRSWIPINGSRLTLVNLMFTIDYKGQIEKINMPLFIPKLIRSYYYIINGTKYYAIYQNVDSSTYNTKDSIILKSLLMPIILRRDKRTFTALNEKSFTTNIYQINLFKHKANILLYFFSVYGYHGTLDYFRFRNDMGFVKKDRTSSKTAIYFPISKTVSLKVNKEKFMENRTFRSFVLCVLDIFNRKTSFKRINDPDYWKVKLGSIFTKNTNSQLEKAETVLVSFRRILDNRTKANLRIRKKDKDDIFALIRWMVNHYGSLMRKDNLCLSNKRLRWAEYQITSFSKKMATHTYRILNSKNLTINRLKTVFSNIAPMSLIGDLQSSELLRYNNAVNDMDVFNCALKFSNRGPAALGEGSRKTVSIAYRGIHPSHLRRLSLNSCSAGDPGMSGTLSPFIKTDGFYYTSVEEDADYNSEGR